MTEDWYWAAGTNGPALDRFVIASGQDELWRRVRTDIDRDETNCSWNAAHRGKEQAGLEDVLDLMFLVMLGYRVSQNRFVTEAAQIPVFADYLRSRNLGLPNYVSNTIAPEVALPVETYSPDAVRRLGRIVSDTLSIEPDWFEY